MKLYFAGCMALSIVSQVVAIDPGVLDVRASSKLQTTGPPLM